MQPLFQEIKDLKVCVLSEKLQLAQNISACLREFGVMPSYFDSVHSFWTSCLHQKIDVAIIDNALLENSGVSLKDHPRIKNKQINVIISYEEPSLIRTDLLSSFHCLGLLGTSQGIKPQINALLQQARQVEDLRLHTRTLSEQTERLRHRNSLLVKNFEDSQRFCDEFIFMQKILEQVDTKLDIGFSRSVEHVFNDLSFIKKFFIVGVNSTKKQLISLSSNERKAVKFQNLWDENLADGIHEFALERICIQAQDQLGGDLIVLKVHEQLDSNPEVLIVMSVEHKNESLMPWRVFEEQLSARYNSLKLSHIGLAQNESNQIKSLWNLAQVLDTDQFELSQESAALIEIDLSGMIDFIDQTTQVRFFWSDFKRDLISGISRVLGYEVNLIENGLKSFIFQTSRELLSQHLVLIEDTCEFFEYWRYFSDSHIVLAQETYPQVKVVANTTKFLTHKQQINSLQKKNIQGYGYNLKKSDHFSFNQEEDFAQ